MPLSRVPRSPDLERVVQVLGGRVQDAAAAPRSGDGWVPERPSPEGDVGPIDLTSRGQPAGSPRRRGRGSGGSSDRGGFGHGEGTGDLDEELRRARRPALLSVPASLRAGRSSVSSSAVVAVLGLVVALGCAFVLRILWAERSAEHRPSGADPSVLATQPPTGPVTPEVLSRSGPPASGFSASSTGTAAALVVVHVVGQVARPGLVRLPAGARVADAIEAAGGATRKADVAVLNLARVVVDGEQVLVPRPGEVPPGAGGAAGPGGTVVGGGAGGPGSSLVNLNTADLAALDSLPGVGPVLAQRILDWRTEHGRFTSTEELGEVSGIGDKLLSQLRPKVSV